MKVGQIYYSVKTGNKARILSIDTVYDKIEVGWFSDGILDSTDRSIFILSKILQLIKEGAIRVYDELPVGNPNLSFKTREMSK